MPELPEIRAHAERMTAALANDTLTAVTPLSFTVLKTFAPPIDDTVGQQLKTVKTRGKHLILDFGTTDHVVHLMQGGRIKPDRTVSPRPRYGLFRWTFETAGSWILTEAGSERRAGIWVVAGGETDSGPLGHLGPEADKVSVEELKQILRQQSGRIHTVLRDQRVIAGIGRMLANEICHRANISPFTLSRTVATEHIGDLHSAVGDAVNDALKYERSRKTMSSSKDRPSLVHNRGGELCSTCGDVIGEVAYRSYTVFYCPTCQTDGRALRDNTTSKFLK